MLVMPSNIIDLLHYLNVFVPCLLSAFAQKAEIQNEAPVDWNSSGIHRHNISSTLQSISQQNATKEARSNCGLILHNTAKSASEKASICGTLRHGAVHTTMQQLPIKVPSNKHTHLGHTSDGASIILPPNQVTPLADSRTTTYSHQTWHNFLTRAVAGLISSGSR